jgi:outer membrane protein OmpA-like peptidoglycan-associated protein
MKKSNFFWVSYADLMTSLFFIMLVLYVVSFAILQSKQGELIAQAEQLKEIKNVQKALEGLDSIYFIFDNVNKRYRIREDVLFQSGSSKITDIPLNKRKELYNAGISLYNKIDEIIQSNPSVDYLLVIEGNTQRSNGNWKSSPNIGYELSYKRALSLFNYWKSRGLDFRGLGSQCEIILAGSGYFGYSRDTENERNNRKFSIQVTSKVGKFLNKKNTHE